MPDKVYVVVSTHENDSGFVVEGVCRTIEGAVALHDKILEREGEDSDIDVGWQEYEIQE